MVINMVLNKPLNNWSLNQWLGFLEKNNPEHKIQLGLERIKQVAQRLHVTAVPATVITVAGTNGKGSTVHALETIYHCAGYKVGSYTSPHLTHFNERIKINLLPIQDKELCELFSIIESAREEIALSYFEVATLAALIHFKKKQLDVIILEVGLGGRLDATNIIDADAAVITTIDYDHQEYLGTTLDEIGSEKAGILRPRQLFIYADSTPPDTILDKATALNTATYIYDNCSLPPADTVPWIEGSEEYVFGEEKQAVTYFSFQDNGLCWDFISPNYRVRQLNKPKILLLRH
jgi:dihydrofolate synthase / folylpolyglutamate synthase